MLEELKLSDTSIILSNPRGPTYLTNVKYNDSSSLLENVSPGSSAKVTIPDLKSKNQFPFENPYVDGPDFEY